MAEIMSLRRVPVGTRLVDETQHVRLSPCRELDEGEIGDSDECQ
jgi:hypothetical protein